MTTKTIAILAFSALAGLAPLHAGAQQGGMTHAQDSTLADGVVRKVDKDAGKLTIKHGSIPSMDMPPMTMVYRVKDPAMLDKVKPGDEIKFQMEKIGGQYTVTRIGAAK